MNISSHFLLSTLTVYRPVKCSNTNSVSGSDNLLPPVITSFMDDVPPVPDRFLSLKVMQIQICDAIFMFLHEDVPIQAGLQLTLVMLGGMHNIVDQLIKYHQICLAHGKVPELVNIGLLGDPLQGRAVTNSLPSAEHWYTIVWGQNFQMVIQGP